MSHRIMMTLTYGLHRISHRIPPSIHIGRSVNAFIDFFRCTSSINSTEWSLNYECHAVCIQFITHSQTYQTTFERSTVPFEWCAADSVKCFNHFSFTRRIKCICDGQTNDKNRNSRRKSNTRNRVTENIIENY